MRYEQKIKDILHEQQELVLAFCDEQGPWSVPVFFAADGYDPLFLSKRGSRHHKAIVAGLEFSASVFKSKAEWQTITGLQLSGKIISIDASKLKEKKGIYFDKFSFAKGILDGMQGEIISNIADVEFFSFLPSRIVLTDNTVRFGFRYELML